MEGREVRQSTVSASTGFDPDASDLLMFYGETCPFTKKALPEVQCMESALNVKIQRLEIWNNKTNAHMFQRLARGKCKGVPFFVNRKTGEFVCGAAQCEVLKGWASSSSAM
ncbi:Glutaredoxin domain-containing protein [Balamuthia mandrillaris]